MRFMNLPPFPRRIEGIDFDKFFAARLGTTEVMYPCQAIALLSYGYAPNHRDKREAFFKLMHSWPAQAESGGEIIIPNRVRRIQADWIRVADIFHTYCDLVIGRHQHNRGGPSIGKAIDLVAQKLDGKGTQPATLWKLRAQYKDVAPIATAAVLVQKEVRKKYRERVPPPGGLSPTQFIPFQMALLMPDLVLAIAQEFERVGLSEKLGVVSEPVLNPETLWRIPADINIEPISPPWRELQLEDFEILNNRRAGNRGQVT